MSPSQPFFQHVRLSELRLRVQNLENVSRFYVDTLGMRALGGRDGQIELGYSQDVPALVVLVESANAPLRPRDAAGLFHVAFLHPNRASLGRAARRLVDLEVPFGGGDHGVSEALYLADPEGNGIELYADRPAEEWPESSTGEVAMYTEEVDVAGILKAGEGEPGGGPEGVRIGHIHLSVADLPGAEQVLARGLGFSVRQRNYPGALFFGRDGYHHHFGANTWRSRRAVPAGSLGLDRFTLAMSPCPEPRELSSTMRQLGAFTESEGIGYTDLRTSDGIGIRVTSLD